MARHGRGVDLVEYAGWTVADRIETKALDGLVRAGAQAMASGWVSTGRVEAGRAAGESVSGESISIGRVGAGLLAVGLLAVGWPTPVRAAIVPAEVVARQGDLPLGSAVPVGSTRPPFVLSDGSVAFTGLLEDGDGYVFVANQVIWRGSDEPMMVLADTEAVMGAAVGGAFIYSPQVDGLDSVWTQAGLLAQEGQPAPVFPAGAVTTFHSRPTMAASGAAYWLAGVSVSGNQVTEQRVLYRSTTGLPANIEVVYSTGQMLGGLTVSSPGGLDFDYQVSDDESHVVGIVDLDTGSVLNNGHLQVDGALLHQEDTLNGTGDDWDNFDLVAIDNSGRYVFSGDTNGSTATDEFVAVDGVISVREGDVIDGVTLTSSAAVRLLSVSNVGRIAHAWAYDGFTTETVFFGCDPTDLAGSSIAVLTTGVDELDLDGDGVGDGLVTDLEANNASSTNALSDDGVLYLEVEINDGGGPLEAIVQIPVSCCGNQVVDFDELCDDGNGDDSDGCPGSCMPATCGDGFVWAGMEECDDGNDAPTDGCLNDCVAATCGDGELWAGVEECDDANGDDTDDCPGGCMVAECGDGFVWAGQEQCDDGNADDTDACLVGCVPASCGDGIVWAGQETCDDGNADDTDACPGSCAEATCGDGFVWAGMEQCDDGNDVDDDACTNACVVGAPGGSTSTGDGLDSTGADSTGDASASTGPGPTGGAGSSDSDVTGPLGSTGEPGPTGSGDDTGVVGLDDDGGCTCRERGGHPGPWAWAPWLCLGWRRRRR